MSMGATLAGLAFSNAGITVVHAEPSIPHGLLRKVQHAPVVTVVGVGIMDVPGSSQ